MPRIRHTRRDVNYSIVSSSYALKSESFAAENMENTCGNIVPERHTRRVCYLFVKIEFSTTGAVCGVPLVSVQMENLMKYGVEIGSVRVPHYGELMGTS